MSRSAGFTLLEILLAIVILGVVVSMLALSLAGSVRVVDATRYQGEVFFQARVILQRLGDDLRSAVLLEGYDFVGETDELAGQRADEVRFATHAHLVFDPEVQQPGLAWIEYRLEEDEENPGMLHLYRSDSLIRPLPEEAETPSSVGFLLGDRLRSFGLTYISASGEVSESWDTSAEEEDEDAGTLPAGVRIAVSFWLDRDNDEFVDFATAVPLMTGLYSVEEGQ